MIHECVFICVKSIKFNDECDVFSDKIQYLKMSFATEDGQPV